jgi:hypothetical protein
MQWYGAELWFNSVNCKRTLNKFAVGYHKAVKKILKIPFFVSNHYVCELVNMSTFLHHLNMVKMKFAYNMCYSNNKMMIKLRNYIINNSCVVNEMKEVMYDKYGVENFINNDLDALISRINFVQRNEERSNFFYIA